MNLNKTRVVTSDMARLTLGGDGTKIPELTLEKRRDGSKVSFYVDSSDLRVLGEAMVKWADKLDKHTS